MASGAPPRAPEQDWSRAGAHNIAGVSFQVAVTAKLLVNALAGTFPLARATPEGSEDIDVELRDGTRVLVQVKERAPSARFGRSNLADALRKKNTLLERDASRRFALVTDATLGGGLAPTGWARPVTECIDRTSVDELAAHLESDFDDPTGVLARTHIVQVERSVVEDTRRELAGLQVIGSQPSVAVLVYARLVEQITEIAARQRSATPDTAQSITPSDLETLATRAVVPGVEPGDRPAREGRYPQASDRRTAQPCVRGPRAHRGVHGPGAAAREPRRRHARLGADQARAAQAWIDAHTPDGRVAERKLS